MRKWFVWRFGTETVRAALIAAVFVPAAVMAQGCGPTRLKVSESVVVGLPPAQVWQLVGDFQNLSWNPLVARSQGSGSNEPDVAVRTLTLRGGAVFDESLYKYDASSRSYSYHIDKIDVTRLPVQNVSATLDVVALDGGARSKLLWRAAFYRYLRPGEPAPDVADADAAKAMSTYLRSCLDGFKAKLDSKT